MRGAWAPEHCTAAGVLHGGYLMTLADAAAATLAFLNLPAARRPRRSRRRRTSSPPSARAPCTARAELVHAGKRTIVLQVDIADDDGRLVSRTLQTQAVIGPRAAATLAPCRITTHDHDHEHDMTSDEHEQS